MKLSRIDKVLSRVRPERGSAASASVESSGADVAGLIGERFEAVQDNLDQLSEMAGKFATFETLLTQLREPLEEEFRSRRDGHVELINLRTAHAETDERNQALTAESRRLTDALTATEARAEDLSARFDEQGAALQEGRLETDRLRNELSQALARGETLESAERAASQRIKELEQDQSGLRETLRLAEEAKVESEGARTQLQRDYALAQEENAALKRRVEETGVEIAALARTAAAHEAQLTAERTRAASEQADAARSLRALESQAETARAEIAALTARLDTTTARGNGLEALNTEHTTRLAELQAAAHAAGRRAETLQTNHDRAVERVRSLEAEAEEARQRQATMETARVAAVDRAEALSKAAASHDKAIARAEERIAKVQALLTKAQEEHQAKLEAMTQQSSTLRAELEGVRAEAAMTAAALDVARRERTGRGAATEGQGAVQSIVG